MFEAITSSASNSIPEFGEALAFYTIEISDTITELLVVYHPVVEAHQVLRRWQGTWSNTIRTARVSTILAIVGTWEGLRTNKVHILRKHPGLVLLNEAEGGNSQEGADTTGNEGDNGELA